jgi:hypothetical protein
VRQAIFQLKLSILLCLLIKEDSWRSSGQRCLLERLRTWGSIGLREKLVLKARREGALGGLRDEGVRRANKGRLALIIHRRQ